MKKVVGIILFLFWVNFVFSQNTKEESIKNDIVEGTLLIPTNKTPVPLVIIIAGSGPTDRDGNNPLAGKSNSYKLLAEGLAQNNIASLRYDKRGIAKSVVPNFKEDNLDFDQYINDVTRWIDIISKDKRFNKIIILGHSEGSLVGMIASKNSKVSKYISLAGTGRPIDEVILQQLKDQKQPENILKDITDMFGELKKGNKIEKPNPMYYSLFRPSVQPYMISWLKYNPQEEIKKLTLPILVVQGTTDLQIPESEAQLLLKASPKAQYLLIEKMNHVLKTSSADRKENFDTYSKPDLPLSDGLINGIVKFIK
ncbi:hypothetical protein AD998_01070 [bacterium 336/3]|nr:hypothetical protein AD998_01070 [bacterium 336/3]